MKRMIITLGLFFVLKTVFAQEARAKVEAACMDYIEGFYEGDTSKLIRSIKPGLYKFGYWKNKNSGQYEPDGQMTFQQAIDYAKRVMIKKNFAKPDAPKKVQVLDIMHSIAAAKVTAWWGVDYILLVKQDDKWMIEQVLWEGPLEK
ncbi:MAG TPA: nuclear transport factor 2 family protein [Ferruginibacter sp.]|nr:nuclear transport factor 2 family protein [Ferruginibacter sp.]